MDRRNSIRLSCGLGGGLRLHLTTTPTAYLLERWRTLNRESSTHRGTFRCHFLAAVLNELWLFGHEGGVSGFVVLELGVSKLFASVHVESPCPPSESVTFGPVPTSVARLTGRRVSCDAYF